MNRIKTTRVNGEQAVELLMTMRRTLSGCARMLAGMLGAALFLLCPVESFAQPAFPSRTIRVISPFPPGAFNDLASRTIALGLQQELGQTVVVENRPGAGSLIGAEFVARSPADGYTLLMASNPIMAILPHLVSNLSFDPVKDLTPVSNVAAAPKLLFVRAGLPVESVRDVISLAKAQPGKLTYASAGNGTVGHLSGELFKFTAGVDITHVPYKGSAPALNDLMGGRVDLQFSDIVSGGGLINSDKLRLLAVMTARRVPQLPEIPTFTESGLDGFESYLWNGIVTRAGTPKEIVQQLSSAIAASLKRANIAAPMTKLGAQTIGDSPEHFLETITIERALWARVVKATGIKLER
jgi:tripartite-type tricarboxylate transporter receptor subunit TctC